MSVKSSSGPGSNVWVPFLLAAVFCVGILIGTRWLGGGSPLISKVNQQRTNMNMSHGKMEEVLRYIDAKYVSPVDAAALEETGIRAIVEELDPHSNYINLSQLQEINEQLEGNFSGIGVEFMVLEDTVVVVAPLAGGPSEALGIQSGDKIVSIEDSIIAGVPMSNRGIMNLLRGEEGTDVNIGIRRQGMGEEIPFTITREAIPMHSVDVAYMVNEETGYIKINRFSATTYDEFTQALDKVMNAREGLRNLVIDLRQNPGGYLQQATRMLSQLFKEKGTLLVYTQGDNSKRMDYNATGRAIFDVENVAILIDEGSASASEIMAGAVQDHDRGIIIGRRSFGKGLVQEQYPLRDGSALRLTVARYYTPSGRSIQKPYDEETSYDTELTDRYHNGEVNAEEGLPVLDSTRYYTTGGRVVYGGGGIIPDVIVPLDTNALSTDYLTVQQHLGGYMIRFFEQNELEGPAKLEDFLSAYQLPGTVYDGFLAYVAEKNETALTPDTELKRFIERSLRARLAKRWYGDDGFFQSWHQQDDMVSKALELLAKPNPLTAIRE